MQRLVFNCTILLLHKSVLFIIINKTIVIAVIMFVRNSGVCLVTLKSLDSYNNVYNYIYNNYIVF